MFRLYKKYLKKNLHLVILGPIFKVIEAIFELLVPFVIKNMIDKGINNDLLSSSEKRRYIYEQGGLLLAFAVIGLCSTLVCQFIASRVSQTFGTDVRNDFFKHINTLSFKELDNLQASSIINRATNDIYNVEKSVAMLIRLVIRSPLIVIGSICLAFYIDSLMGIVFLVTSIIIFLIFALITKLSFPNNKKVQKKMDKVLTKTRDSLNGERQVRAFRKEEYEKSSFTNENTELTKLQIFVGKINALLNPLTFVVVNLAIVLVMYIGGIKISTSRFTQGDIQALINYLNQIFIAIVAITGLVQVFSKAHASSLRINEVFDMKSSIIDGEFEAPLDTDTIIEFDNVTFKYNDNASPALDNVSFKIKKGETIGIIGGTGSGKTTIVNLINRFYDTTEGSVYYLGRNVKDYKYSFINHEISTVLQHATLFNGTIESNLKWGSKNASLEDLKEALKIAQAEFVLDKGLDSRVLEGGQNLSGGQRQRIGIARAILKKGNVIILDDSSSALDYQTDYRLRMALKELNITTIIISQRAQAISYADKILVLDNGKLVGFDKHLELIKNNTVYQEICESQEVEVRR